MGLFIKLEYLTADKAVSAARHNVPLQMKLGLQTFDVLVIDPSISTFQRRAVMTDKCSNTYLPARLGHLRRVVTNYLIYTAQGALVDKFIPACLSKQQEPIEIALDSLDYAEKQEAIPSVAYWIEARRLCNSAVHKYAGDVALLRQSILRTLEHCSNV